MKGMGHLMDNESGFDQFASNYREIHTENIQGISGVNSSYFGRQKIEMVHRNWVRGGGKSKQ